MSDEHAPASPIFPSPSLAVWAGVGLAITAAIMGFIKIFDISFVARACIIPVLPFGGFVAQIFFGKKLPRWGDWLPTACIFASFVFTVTLAIEMFSNFDPNWSIGGVEAGAVWTWMDFGRGNVIQLGVMLDNTTVIIGLMVSLTAFLIHLFSIGYMEGEIRYSRFFAYIGLFSSAMLGLVYSDNLLSFFMFWEVMGLCSYLLIGFYFERPSACNASLKAFMTTRVGDTFMFLGIVGIYFYMKEITGVGSLRFVDIFAVIESGAFSQLELMGYPALTLIAFCIFLGTVGKSAQFPLQVWLPDAMEGPTPVSALIHAATMVSAGVFLIVRTFPLLDAGNILPIIAFVGGFTAMFAAILAVVQYDIKKVLAYSTLSQLGYMVLSIGVGGYVYAFFHLITHACFKAQLFMGSGSVIKAMHHEQDMRQMGGLRKKMFYTWITMGIATCAISGVPFFSGFISKDGILAQVLYMGHFSGIEHEGFALFVYKYWAPFTGFGAAILTAFYMFRMMFMTFAGKPRNQEKYDHAKENKWPILFPLILLACLCIGVGFQFNNWFKTLVIPHEMGMYAANAIHSEEGQHHAHTIAMYLSIAIATAGILFSCLVYYWKLISADNLKKLWPRFFIKALDNLYYFDWFYIKIVIQKILLPWNMVVSWVDSMIIDLWIVDVWAKIMIGVETFVGRFDDLCVDSLVDGTGAAANKMGGMLRVVQNGYVQFYFIIALGGIGFPLMYFLIWR